MAGAWKFEHVSLERWENISRGHSTGTKIYFLRWGENLLASLSMDLGLVAGHRAKIVVEMEQKVLPFPFLRFVSTLFRKIGGLRSAKTEIIRMVDR
jgi:hypothetical protein